MKIEENIPLAPFTTLRIGGPARYFVQGPIASIRKARRFAEDKGIPFFVLGTGSNLVVSDAGFPGLVLRIAGGGTINQANYQNRGSQDIFFEVDAAVEWDALVRHVCELGMSGMECLAGIPGTVGAAPVQNIGAYGQEVSQTIEFVGCIDPLSKHKKRVDFFNADECGFAYRRSIFNSVDKDRYVIFIVGFRLDREAKPRLTYPDLQRHFATNPNPTPIEVYHAVREIRARKGMLIDPANPTPDSTSAGSFFKNPVVALAALDRIATYLGIRVDEIQHWPISAHPEAADLGGTVPQQGTGQTKLPAAWLIERAGFPKGYTLGPVGISTKHTLALTNRTGTATCADLFALRDRIITGVEDAFGIELEQEPVYLS